MTATLVASDVLGTDLHEGVLELTLTNYNAMLKGPYDLLLARQSELAAERGYINALRDYWIARSDLERTVGGQSATTTSKSNRTFKETISHR